MVGPLAVHFVLSFNTGSYSLDRKKVVTWAFELAETIVDEQEKRVKKVLAEMREEPSSETEEP